MSHPLSEIYITYLGIILITLLLIGFIVTMQLYYQKKRLVQEKKMDNLKTAFEKELLQTQLEITEDVLKNVSMEIHDNIGQIMLLANVNISMLQSLSQSSENEELILQTKDLLLKASEDISQLSRGFHSDRITQIGVFAAMRYELELLVKKGLFTLDIQGDYQQDGTELSKETQLLIFRMYQEIVKNIIKHANATHIVFQQKYTPGGILIVISDNGYGFDTSVLGTKSDTSNGIGLRSLTTRAKLFHGNITIESKLLKGTTISIFIPG